MEMTIRFPGGKQVAADVRGHTVLTDQPRFGGGDDAAPAPYELFLASLGTCAGIYVLGFCESRGIPTEGIELVQRHSFDPRTHVLTGVTLDIHVPATFPAKYHDALVRVAGQCAVKRTLDAPPSFEVRTLAAAA
jgi:ribosomal protein S12 methylthiotransferase accessory factor